MEIKRRENLGKIKIEHNWKLFWVIIFLIICLIVLVWFIVQKDAGDVSDTCIVDSDCVPASCCHANKCVLKNEGPDCEGMFCSMECSSILDCGAGRCGCVRGACGVV